MPWAFLVGAIPPVDDLEKSYIQVIKVNEYLSVFDVLDSMLLEGLFLFIFWGGGRAAWPVES